MPLVSLNVQKDKNDINRLAGGEFLQSTLWLEVLSRSGAEAEIFGFYEEEKIKSLALIVKKKTI